MKRSSSLVTQLATDPGFLDGVEELATALDRREDDVLAEALRCLDEMATVQRHVAGKLWARWARFHWARSYDLDVDGGAVDRIRDLAADHPLVFLPSHKSYLDGYVMVSLLHDAGLPPNHVFGGINMAFWPIGGLGRRVGVIWIRRRLDGDDVYKFVLRRYLARLIADRRSLEWYIEGGRSRTGKLLPPKMGLLSYLARGVQEEGVGNVRLVPVSIVYDQLAEVIEMTRESQGATKRPESFRWLARYAWNQRGRQGTIRVRFGEPVPLDPAADGDQTLALSKVAFEVCTRINRATPVTSASLATLALLGADGWAVTIEEALSLVRPLRAYLRRRHLPGNGLTAELDTRSGMERVLEQLQTAGVIDRFDEGSWPVVRISPARELSAAFYRNQIIHWFVNRAIVELSLVAVAERGGRCSSDLVVREGLLLRDLLKFEFFFAERDEFVQELRGELDLIFPNAPLHDVVGLPSLAGALDASGGFLADRVLRSFLEAYWVVADQLARLGDAMIEDGAFINTCLRVGRQYQLQRRIVSGEAISKELFQGALKLARNRQLLDWDNPVRPAGRQALANELHEALRRLEVLNRSDQSAQTRREGTRPALPLGLAAR